MCVLCFNRMQEHVFFNSTGYAIFTCENKDEDNSGIERSIERDIDNTMYWHIRFSHNKDSFWKMLLKQLNSSPGKSFTFVSTQKDPFANAWEEVTYLNEFGEGFTVLMSNCYLRGIITITVRLPFCEPGCRKFIKWQPSEARCIDELRDLIHAIAASLSMDETYYPGTLLGEYKK
jgi:hypothetical protein